MHGQGLDKACAGVQGANDFIAGMHINVDRMLVSAIGALANTQVLGDGRLCHICQESQCI